MFKANDSDFPFLVIKMFTFKIVWFRETANHYQNVLLSCDYYQERNRRMGNMSLAHSLAQSEPTIDI